MVALLHDGRGGGAGDWIPRLKDDSPEEQEAFILIQQVLRACLCHYGIDSARTAPQ